MITKAQVWFIRQAFDLVYFMNYGLSVMSNRVLSSLYAKHSYQAYLSTNSFGNLDLVSLSTGLMRRVSSHGQPSTIRDRYIEDPFTVQSNNKIELRQSPYARSYRHGNRYYHGSHYHELCADTLVCDFPIST